MDGTRPVQRWKKRPSGSTWGDFGPDDQLGRLNLLRPDHIRNAVAEVKEGLRFCLGMPLDYPGDNTIVSYRLPPRLRATVNNGRSNMNWRKSVDMPGCCDILCDDAVELSLQYSTHWDSLAHVGQLFDADGDGEEEVVYYNGYRAGEHVVDSLDGRLNPTDGGGALALGIQNVAQAGVQGRGVMIDLEHHFGRDFRLVGYDDVMRVMERDRVEVGEGDFVCFRTGTVQLIYSMNRKPDNRRIRNTCCKIDGRDKRLQDWITDTGVVALIADNEAVEASPSQAGDHDPRASLPLHAHCLFRLGVYLGEFWDLAGLADWLRASKRSRFLLTAPPLRLPRAVASPVTPIATV